VSKTFVPSASSGSERSAAVKPEATDFGTFGRFEETAVGEMPVAMKEAYDFTMKLRGLVPGPHRIWLANPELSKTVAPIGASPHAWFRKASIGVRNRCWGMPGSLM